MKTGKLKDITGKTVKGWYEWLKENQCGCCSVEFESDSAYRYCVCMGFHDDGDGWQIAWKIGRQSHRNVMQTDLDIDFEMPYNEETGDVDDTEQVVDFGDRKVLMKEWNALAAEMRDTARRVWNDWRLPEEDCE